MKRKILAVLETSSPDFLKLAVFLNFRKIFYSCTLSRRDSRIYFSLYNSDTSSIIFTFSEPLHGCLLILDHDSIRFQVMYNTFDQELFQVTFRKNSH
jgi:hypothetical protein